MARHPIIVGAFQSVNHCLPEGASGSSIARILGRMCTIRECSFDGLDQDLCTVIAGSTVGPQSTINRLILADEARGSRNLVGIDRGNSGIDGTTRETDG